IDNAQLPDLWLDEAQLHPWDIDTPSQEYWNARELLLGSLGMMMALVQNPREKLLCEGMGYHNPAALNFIVRTRIPDILCEPDVQQEVGLHVSDIAARARTHPGKTERILRFLAIHHIFTETAPSCFANNRLSVCLKEGLPNAYVPLYWGDISFRSATAFSRILRDPATSHSTRCEDSPFSAVFGRIDYENLEHVKSNHDTKLIGSYIESFQRPLDNTDNSINYGNPTKWPVTKVHYDLYREPKVLTAFDFLDLPQCAMYRTAFAQGMQTLEIMNGGRGYEDFDWCRKEWDLPGTVFVEVRNYNTSSSALIVLKLLHF
ncbi:hypothetical protein M422DRAFT_248911, partial [Sphaerobolus stellatus SS14]